MTSLEEKINGQRFEIIESGILKLHEKLSASVSTYLNHVGLCCSRAELEVAYLSLLFPSILSLSVLTPSKFLKQRSRQKCLQSCNI